MNKPPNVCYLICSAPRSGSNLFSDFLADTHLAGYPQEHFNPWHMGHAQGEFPKELIYDRTYVQGLIEQYTTPNGVFGTKAQFEQIISFVGLGQLENLFPTELRYIHIQRVDHIRQAVSLARAMQTEQWKWDDKIDKEPKYNPQQIVCCLREIDIQEKGWEVHFHERGIEPFRVVYEELVKNPESAVVGALRYLGVSIPGNFQVPAPRLRKQADQLSDEWVNKFKAD